MFGIDDAAMGMIISGAMQGGSSLLGGMMGSSAQSAANSQNWLNNMTMFNMQQNSNQHFLDQQQGYNTMMANSAYQRSMNDMKLAGLNPILAAGGNVTNIGSGGSASGPNIGAPNMVSPGGAMQAGMAGVGQSAASAVQAKLALTQADKDASQTKLNAASEGLTQQNEKLASEATKRTTQETSTSAATEDAQKAQAAAARAQAAQSAANVGLILQQTNSASAQARIDNATATDVEKFGVPRNESWTGFLGRVLRGNAPAGLPSSAKSVPSSGPTIEVKPKDWGSWDPRNWFK